MSQRYQRINALHSCIHALIKADFCLHAKAYLSPIYAYLRLDESVLTPLLNCKVTTFHYINGLFPNF